VYGPHCSAASSSSQARLPADLHALVQLLRPVGRPFERPLSQVLVSNPGPAFAEARLGAAGVEPALPTLLAERLEFSSAALAGGLLTSGGPLSLPLLAVLDQLLRLRRFGLAPALVFGGRDGRDLAGSRDAIHSYTS
jgi:hypothetical protein